MPSGNPGRPRRPDPSLGTCPECGEVPRAGSACKACKRTINRRDQRNHRAGGRRDLVVPVAVAEYAGISEGKAHRLALERLVAIMENPKTPLYIQAQVGKTIIAQGWQMSHAEDSEAREALKLLQGG